MTTMRPSNKNATGSAESSARSSSRLEARPANSDGTSATRNVSRNVDNGMTGDVFASTPLLTPLLPPRISSTSHASLVQWRKDHRDYEETARARAKDGANDVIVPVKTTFDQGLLRLWCRLRWHISIDEVTDDHIMAEVDRIIASVKNNNVPDIDYEMRSKQRINLKETDVSERVIQYFKTCHDIIEDNGWSIFFDDDTGKKQLCRILIASLEPQALREDIERTIRFQARKANEDEVVLHDLILEKALEHDKVFQRQRREKRERGEGDNKSQSSSRPNKTAKKTSSGSGQRIVSAEQPAKTSVDRPKVPPKPCPHCEDMHWLSERTKATDDV